MEKHFNMYVLTDPHFLSKELWTEGEPITRRERGDQIALKASPEILDSFFDIIINDKSTPFVLITGDLVNAGEVISHRDFKQQLKRLTDAGKTVYVTTATHDYCGGGEDGDENGFHAVGYGEKECYPVEYVNRKKLYHLYDEYGPSDADSVHGESGSYSICPQEGIRLIAINDNGNGRSYCGLSENGFDWLEAEIKKANKSGECVLLAVHHPVVPPWEIYRLVADFEMLGGYEKLSRLMCRENVRIVFTGHTHVQNIQRYSDCDGGYFYDVSTTALGAAKGKIRKVSVDVSERKCTVSSIGIDRIKGLSTPLSASEYIDGLNFAGLTQRLASLALEDWDEFLKQADGFLDVNKIKKHRFAVRLGVKVLKNMKMSFPAKFAKKYTGLSRSEIKALKNESVLDRLFVIMRHVFSGNAPFTPDTVEYKVFNGVCEKADKLLCAVKRPLGSFVKGATSIKETAQPFLYNNRTGDDDNLTLKL